jgi:hypothetical protein
LRRDGLGEADLSPFQASARMTDLALSELSAAPPTAIAKAWVRGMIVNLAAPAILVDPRVRKLSKRSFFEMQGTGLADKVWRYVTANGPLYVALFAVGAAGSIVTLVLAAYGLVRLWRRHPWAAVFAVLAVLYFLLVSGPVGSPKYRLPFEPIMIVLTALGGLGLWDRRRGRAPSARDGAQDGATANFRST